MTRATTAVSQHRRGQRLAILLAASLLLSIVLHLWRLGDIPPGFFCDESAIGYNAYSIAETGADEYGSRVPIFFRSFDNYQDAVAVYTVVPLVKWFGLERSIVRLPSALYHVLASVTFGLLVFAYVPHATVALLGGLMFSVLPWIFPVSRSIMSGYTPMLLGLTIGWWAGLVAIRRNHLMWALPSIFGWVFAMYSHNTARPIAAVMIVCLLAAHGGLLRTRLRLLGVSFVTILVLMSPLIIYVWRGGAALTQRFKNIAVWYDHPSVAVLVGRVFRNYLDYFGPSFLFLHGDSNLRHHTGVGGVLPVAMAPLIAVGLYQGVRRWRSDGALRALLLIFVTFPVAAILTADRMHATRSINGAISACLLALVGLHHLWRGAEWRRALAVVAIMGLVIQSIVHLGDYFNDYGRRARPAFDAPWIETLTYAFAQLDANERLYLSVTMFPPGTGRNFKPVTYATLLFLGKVDPAQYQRSGMAGTRVIPYEDSTGAGGILVRAEFARKYDDAGGYRLLRNPESIPPGARQIRTFPVEDGNLYEVYRLPKPGDATAPGTAPLK